MTTALITSAVLRAEAEADVPFLRTLFASTRTVELAALPEGIRSAFCDQQLDAQRRAHRTRYPAASFDVIVLDGEPVGRLAVDRSDVVTIVDVAVLPDHRGRGIAGAVLLAVLVAAAAAGRVVELHVACGNPAADWYARLGFEPTANDGVYLAMRRLPDAPIGGGGQ